jgi:hypothetical protein
MKKSIVTLAGNQRVHQMFSMENYTADCLNWMARAATAAAPTPQLGKICGVGDFLSAFPCVENALFLLAFAQKADGAVPPCSISDGDDCCCGNGTTTQTSSGISYTNLLPCTDGEPVYLQDIDSSGNLIGGYAGTTLYDIVFTPTTWLNGIELAVQKSTSTDPATPDGVAFPPAGDTTVGDAITWIKVQSPFPS